MKAIFKIIKNKIVNAIYNTPRIFFINFYRLCVVRIRVFDTKKIPNEKSAIFAFNHTTGADPIIVLGALRKKIYFIADSDRFRTKFTDFFFRKFLNSIPIFKQEFIKNFKSFKELFTISKGRKIFFGIFPEGDLIKNGVLGKFHGGAAYLSYKTRLPIIPVYIHNIHRGPNPDTWCSKNPIMEGIYSLFSNTFRRINVFIGEPIDPVAESMAADFKEFTDKNTYKKILNKITSELEKEFLELKNEAENLIKKRDMKISDRIPDCKASESAQIKAVSGNTRNFSAGVKHFSNKDKAENSENALDDIIDQDELPQPTEN